MNAPLTKRGGYDATRELLSNSDTDIVTAIFAGNDVCASGVLDAVLDLGMQVSRRRVGGWHDNTPVVAFRTISLTTVDQFATEIGAEAMRSVLARVKRRSRPARRVSVPPASWSAPQLRHREASS